MESHFVCTGGCKGLSEVPGTCQAPDCPKHEKPLTECQCSDGEHKEAYDKDNNEA